MSTRPPPGDHRGPPGGGAGTGGPPPAQRPSRPLEGTVALVVGGERGLGRHVVGALARAGADVAVGYDEDRPGAHDDARAAEDLVTRSGRSGLLLPTDLTDPHRCHQLVDDTVDHLGGLSLLVHVVTGASTTPTARGLETILWRRTWALLVESLVHTTTAAVDHLAEGGRLLTTAEAGDGAREDAPFDLSVASATVQGLSRALSEELAAASTRVVCMVPLPGADPRDVADWYVRLATPTDAPSPDDPVLAGRQVPM